MASEGQPHQIGDHIDHRDDVGRFLLATINGVNDGLWASGRHESH